ncbi:MAG: UbiX family flavin prenyltransferase [Sedimentisphaerales bacterium]|nr:UbiX family flavin prenyltransferase [Sedimentisphaerales bacterium]
MNKTIKPIIIGITGASGAVYARRLVDLLEQAGYVLDLIITDPGRRLIQQELQLADIGVESLLGRSSQRIKIHANDNLFDPLASGSAPTRAMVICPCSSHSLAAIAGGLADTLLLRAAYVSLKQRRRLVLVHREMPLTCPDLDNMKRITLAGGIICPAAPAFYHRPGSVADLVDSVVGRVLDLLEIPHELPVRWTP